MKKSEKFLSDVAKEILNIADQKKTVMECAEKLYKKYKIPTDLSTDYLTMRSDIITATPEVAAAIGLLFGIDSNKDLVANWTFETEKLPKQLEYEMIEIAEDQWIGKISVSELMKLRDAQVINYNENTQRVMKRINKGNEEIYTITLNKKAILSMEELFSSGTYIPNTITLNVPEGTNITYKNGVLIIKNLDHFDITDGYHRYIAMSNLYNLDNTFDYPMELRITNYKEDKSRQLIWQEDQKTKMSRIDSESMNANATANKIAQRLNISSTCNLAGMICQNGIINSAELAEIIRATYLPVSKISSKKQELNTIISAEKEIREGLNRVTEEDTDLMEHSWKRDFLYCLIYNINKKENPDILLEETTRMAAIAREEKMFKGREVTRTDMKRLNDMKGGRKKCTTPQ